MQNERDIVIEMQLERSFCSSMPFVLHPDTIFTSSIIILKSRSIYLITLRKKQLWLGNVHGDSSTSSATGSLRHKEIILVLPSSCSFGGRFPRNPLLPQTTPFEDSQNPKLGERRVHLLVPSPKKALFTVLCRRQMR